MPGPLNFVFGAWLPEPTVPSATTWAARGVNTAVAGEDDAFGWPAGNWYSAYTGQGMKVIKRPTHVNAPTNTLATDDVDPNLLAFMTYDEPELSFGAITPAILQNEIDTWRAAGATKPIGGGWSGNGPAIEGAGYNPWFAVSGLNWQWFDIYPFTGLSQPYWFGDLQANHSFTDNFTTTVGRGVRVLKGEAPYATNGLIPHPATSVMSFIATGRVTKDGLGNPLPRLTASQFSILFWSLVINGGCGAIWFPQYDVGGPDFVADDTNAAVEGYIADVVAKIAQLESYGGVNYLMDPGGGRRAYTLRKCCKTAGGTAGQYWPDRTPDSPFNLFTAQVGNEMPPWFEGAELTVGAVTLRLVCNLHDTETKSLTDAPWGLTAVSFGPGQVRCFDAANPTVDIFDGGVLFNADFTSGGTVAGISFTLSRAAPATTYAQKADGSWSSHAANAARINNDGLTLEGARTNELTQNSSIDVDNGAAWTLSGLASVTGGQTDPAGGTTAFKLTEPVGGGAQGHSIVRFGNSPVTMNVQGQHTVYVKGGTRRYMGITYGTPGYGSPDSSCVVDTLLGTIVSQTIGGGVGGDTPGPAFTIEGAGGGWHRVTLPYWHASGGNGNAVVAVGLQLDATTASYNGDGSDGYVWLPQFEVAAAPSTPIATPGSTTVARSADDFKSSTWSEPVGNYYVETQVKVPFGFPAAGQTFLDLNDNTDSNKLWCGIRADGKLALEVTISGTTYAVATSATALSFPYTATLRVVRNGGKYALFANGVQVNCATLPAVGWTRIQGGAKRDLSLPLFGKLQTLKHATATIGLSPETSRWNGTAGSGYLSIPSVPAIAADASSAAGEFMLRTNEVYSGNFDIGIRAAAKGGIASVDFFFEGFTSTATTETSPTVTDDNGRATKRPGWWTTAPIASLLAVAAAGGGVDAYAKVTPTDTNLSPVIVGPLRIWARPTLWPHIYTVSPTGLADDGVTASDHTTIKAALEAAVAAARPNALIRLTKSNVTYPLTNVTGSTYDVPAGQFRIQAAAGVTNCTLGRASADYTNPATWDWVVPINGLDLVGGAITVDVRYFTGITTPNRPVAARGITITNSNGAAQNYEWNKGNQPLTGFAISGANDNKQPREFVDCQISHLASSFTQDSRLALFNRQLDIVGDVYDRSHLVMGNQDNGFSSAIFRTAINACLIWYTGTGTATLAGNANIATALNCTDSASPGGFTVTFVDRADQQSGASVHDFAGLKAYLEGRGTGWNVTVQDDTRRCNLNFGGFGSGNVPTTVGAARQVTTFLDVHGDYEQTFGAVQRKRQFCFNSLRKTNTDLSGLFFMDGQFGPPNHRDYHVYNNYFPGGYGNTGFPTSQARHVVWDHNTFGAIAIEQGPRPSSFDSFTNNIVNYFSTYKAANLVAAGIGTYPIAAGQTVIINGVTVTAPVGGWADAAAVAADINTAAIADGGASGKFLGAGQYENVLFLYFAASGSPAQSGYNDAASNITIGNGTANAALKLTNGWTATSAPTIDANTAYGNLGATPGGSGPIALGAETATSGLEDFANDDYRPKLVGGVLRANLKTPTQKYDIQGTLRSATDAVGCCSVNSAAPSW